MTFERWPGDPDTVKLTVRVTTETLELITQTAIIQRKAIDDVADEALFRHANRAVGNWESAQLTELEAVVRASIANEKKET